MPGAFPPQQTDDFWSQFQQDQQSDASRTFDPAQRSPNTGISGGLPTQAPIGSLGSTPMMDPTQRTDQGVWQTNPQAVQWLKDHPNATADDMSSANLGGTPPIPPAANGYTPPTSGQHWDQNSFAQQFGSPNTPQELEAMEAQITAAGGKVIRNAAGVAGKIQTPDGRVIDIINSAGAGGKGFQWLEGPGGGGVVSGGSSLANLGYGFGSSMAPWTQNFQAPDPNQIANDPYYQFQLKEGMKGIQNSAAARGTLLTGGTLKGLEQYGQGLASSFGDKAYDRGMGEYLLNRDNFFQNQDRPFNKNLSLANLGRPQ